MSDLVEQIDVVFLKLFGLYPGLCDFLACLPHSQIFLALEFSNIFVVFGEVRY